MKYYAIRKGRKPGIYTSWDECKELVKGYSNPEYKSFTTKAEAEAFINKVSLEAPKDWNGPIFYVDGSIRDATFEQVIGYGIVLVNKDKHVKDFYMKSDMKKFYSYRNELGELEAGLRVLQLMDRLEIKQAVIAHDYIGVKNYIDGTWKANKDCAIWYRDTFARLVGDKQIGFKKIAAHTGHVFNERADVLAKIAVGLATEDDLPMI